MLSKLFARTNEDRPLLAIILLLIGVVTLGLQDALMKLMSVETSFWQIQTLRSLANLFFLVILAAIGGGLALLIPDRKWAALLRAMFLTMCMFCFFAGAPYLSIAQMGAGLYTYPIFVSLLAGPVLGEKVGLWRASSILLGAIGAAIVLSPWKENFSWLQVLPVCAGFFYACNIMMLRRFCRKESPLALAFVVALFFAGSGLTGIIGLSLFPPSAEVQESMPFISIGWPELTGLIAGFAILASVLNLTGNLCLTKAYQSADASLLAPLDFSYLLFAALWSKVIFDQWPTGTALFGMLLIMAAGMVTAWREQVTARRQTKRIPGRV